jgi:hypothetical protein
MLLDQYKVSGELVKHYVGSGVDKYKLFLNLLETDKVCGTEMPDGITVLIRCEATIEKDGLNEAASNILGIPVAGDALLFREDPNDPNKLEKT